MDEIVPPILMQYAGEVLFSILLLVGGWVVRLFWKRHRHRLMWFFNRCAKRVVWSFFWDMKTLGGVKWRIDPAQLQLLQFAASKNWDQANGWQYGLLPVGPPNLERDSKLNEDKKREIQGKFQEKVQMLNELEDLGLMVRVSDDLWRITAQGRGLAERNGRIWHGMGR